MKRSITWAVNDALLDRLRRERRTTGRREISIVEQALAEYLNVPLANRDLPEQPVEICPQCQRGVLHYGRCAECRWRRDPRASLPEAKRSHEAVVRARVS